MKHFTFKYFLIGMVTLFNNQIFSQTFPMHPYNYIAWPERPAEEKKTQIVLSDMSQCTPENALSRKFEKDRWRLIDYETEYGLKGTMVSAQPEDSCGELKLSLGVEGLHKIYLGIHYTRSRHSHSSYGSVQVKLTGDAGFRRVGMETEDAVEGSDREYYKTIHEVYWKTANLTGKSLVIRQQQYPYNRYHIPRSKEGEIIQKNEGDVSNISYVRLVPLSKEEKRQWEEAQPREETRNLAAFFCTGQFTGHTRGTYTFHPTSKEFIKDEFEPYANSDIKILIFEALRGNFCVYNTSIGDVGTKDNRWQDNWVDPLAEFTKLAHENGMKIFVGLRMIGPQYPMNRQPIAWASHYWKHPEWSKLNREGVPISNWSLAFPEVRKYLLSLLRETLDYGIDGIQLYLHRSAPFIAYEEPVVSSFQEKYGEDPRKLPRKDPRWQAHCTEYVTQFIREVRALVDEKPGRELGVAIAKSKYCKQTLLDRNYDVETWLREGLVDYIMPSPYVDLPLLKKWREIGGDSVHIWPDLMPRSQSAVSYAKTAKKYYEAGADGLSLWDAERRHAKIGQWAAAQRLGHIDLLDRLIKEGKYYYRRVYLKYLDGFDVEGSFNDG